MRTIPRIGGTWWFALLALLLVFLMAPGINAQEPSAAPDEEAAGTEEAEVGEPSVVGGEPVDMGLLGQISTGGENLPVDDLLPEPMGAADFPGFNFEAPTGFSAMDRPNDAGGGLAIVWGASTSDKLNVVVDPVTEAETSDPYGQYMVFHSSVGPDGPWELVTAFPSNTSYVWEDPNNFGFFLSPKKQGSGNHFTFYEHTYPATGVYGYEIMEDPEIPGNYIIGAYVYDDSLDNYQDLQVYARLKPLEGEKTLLEYVPPEDGVPHLPWENYFRASVRLDQLGIPVGESDLKTTTSYFIIYTARVRGVAKGVLEVKPIEDLNGNITINSSGSEPEVPDNRDPHWFRGYAVPLEYVPATLPEGVTTYETAQLPPDAWLIGTADEKVAVGNVWNWARLNTFIFSIFICTGVLLFIASARKGAALFVRRIAGLDHVEEAIGRATEMGRPILYTTGLGGVSDIATIASMNILGQVARKVADYESRLINPHRDPIVLAVCQEIVQEAYIDAGRPDSFNKDDIFFITDDQFAYTAAVDGIMIREKPATNLFMGLFFAESLLLAETGASTGAIQIAGTDALAQLPFFITACDYTLIGEELYAASAYLSREPKLLGSLKGQDLAKMVFMVAIVIGTLLLCITGREFFQQLFQVF